MARDSPGRFQSDPKAAPDGTKDRIMVPRWFPDAGKVAQDDPEMLQGSPERLPKSSVTARWPGLPEMLSRSSPGIPIWLQVPHECPKIAFQDGLEMLREALKKVPPSKKNVGGPPSVMLLMSRGEGEYAKLLYALDLACLIKRWFPK